MTTWKDVLGYEGIYQVSSMGRVKSLGRFVKSGSGIRENQVRWQPEKILNPTISKIGYKVITLRKDNKSKCMYLHRLIAEAFIQPLTGNLEVDHIDGDKLNNSLDNLRVCSAQKNLWNVRKREGSYTSKFKGVCFDKNRNKFKAEITINGKCKSIGRFETEQAAAIAYNNEAVRLFGEYANLNTL